MRRFSLPGWRMPAGVIASALLLGLYSRGGAAWPLGFVALVPWLLALNATRGAAGAVLGGYAMSLGLVAAIFAWFGFAIAAYTGLSPGAGLLVLAAAAPLLQPQAIAFALMRHLAGRRHGPVLRALAGASAWVAAEWLLPKLLGDTLGHGLHPSPLLRQGADLAGAAGLSFVLILVNEALAHAIARRRDGLRALARPLGLAAATLALTAGYGALRLSTLEAAASTPGTPLRVGMVQSNLYDYERLRREMGGAYPVVRHVLDTHYTMSVEAVERHRVDALLWSETVYPTTFGSPKSDAGGELDREILDFVGAVGVPLVFGTYDRDGDGEYNAAAVVEPAAGSARTLGAYRKSRLFLLTEYVPPALDGPAFRERFPWAGTWRPGSGARVFPLRLADGREVPVAPMICLDDVDTGLAIDGARLGAQALLGMSNDSWFTEHPEGVRLHLTVAAFRSIETRLPQLRVTANGISAVIAADGAVVAQTGMGEQKLLIGEIDARPPPTTLLVRWGDWLGPASTALLLLLAGIALARGWRRRGEGRAAAEAAPGRAQAGSAQDFEVGISLLSPTWRAVAGLLRLIARGSVLWMMASALIGGVDPADTLARIWSFAALVLAPEAAAWSILRAGAARARIEGERLVLEQRERRIEIAVGEIASASLWAFPLPQNGLQLGVGATGDQRLGIAVADPAGLIEALLRAGARPALADALASRGAAYARARGAAPRVRLDHPLFRFVLFPLVPALPAFRLHQVIAYGGTFGEYHTFGLQAYLSALGIWWASWAIGLVLFAAGLRAAIEAATLLALALRPARAVEARRQLERAGRLLFYVGVPLGLLLGYLLS